MTPRRAAHASDLHNTRDGPPRGARTPSRRDAGAGHRDVPRARQALASRPRRRARGGAADGGDQLRLRPAARHRLDAAPRAGPLFRAVARGAWLAPAIRRALGHELLRVARAARERLARDAGDDLGEPAGAARRQRQPPALVARRRGDRPGPHAAVRRDRGRRARAAPPPPPRRDAAGPRARRPQARVRRAAPGDRGGARAEDRGGGSGARVPRRQAGRRPISATGATATNASPAIAHQPES